jgi:hypothetical protein
MKQVFQESSFLRGMFFHKILGKSKMPHHPKKKKPSPRLFLANLRVDMPWRDKIRLLFRNNWIKIRNVQNCCGHPGEPGC